VLRAAARVIRRQHGEKARADDGVEPFDARQAELRAHHPEARAAAREALGLRREAGGDDHAAQVVGEHDVIDLANVDAAEAHIVADLQAMTLFELHGDADAARLPGAPADPRSEEDRGERNEPDERDAALGLDHGRGNCSIGS
jgi:hypothetical protein